MIHSQNEETFSYPNAWNLRPIYSTIAPSGGDLTRRLIRSVLLGYLCFNFGCSQEKPTAPIHASPLNTGISLNQSASSEVAAAESLPKIEGPAGYLGSKSCRECHEEQYDSWHRSYHRTMTQIAGPDSVKANFHGVILTNNSTRFTLSQKESELWVRMERLADGGGSNPSLDVRMGLVTGSHHMQVFWLADESHNCQIGFPFTWLIPEQRWAPRNSTFLRPPNMELRSETWNHVCARCHATGSQPNLDRRARTWHTQVAELGISCEACHGPGDRHVVQQRELAKLSQKPKNQDRTIVHPKEIDPIRASQICGFCHSMKWWDHNEGWPERGFSFRPGDDLEKTTPIIRPKQIEKQPWLKNVLQSTPEIFSDFFWSDGMMRVSGREYNGLIESPCYTSQRFSCLSCHSLHKGDPDDQLASNRKDNQACTQCHEQFRETSVLANHTHHLANSAGSSCYNCHMPHTTYGVLKAIRSHQISSPKVADELSTGRPNACNLCHLDKPLAWTADRLSAWFKHPKPELSGEQTEIADSVRMAIAGDAGQRALFAWHFGWQPAGLASGRDWFVPILGRLLDDPYAAVRCVAERSLKQLGNFLPAEYDYTINPDTRAPANKVVVENWRRSISTAANPILPLATGVQRNDVTTMEDELNRLASRRDDRPIRLRE